ncbi:MAG TPA: ABC transporter ATP-binding protein [Syntrophorhabdales bacterium]|nr:ABC transporter ATP-binding protein [Syntrophorhabdales bacterium]
MKALEVQNVDTYYGTSHVLHGLSLEVPQGQLVCLMGRNGAGKTTTIRSIMGMTRPTHGSIKIFGEEVAGSRSNEIYRKGARIVPQGWHIFPMLSVEENLRLALIGQSSPDFKAETEKAFRMFPILGERKRQKARTLSGGELQMLAIARAMMGPTRLLLMDEPSEGLAPVILAQIGRTVQELKSRDITILLAEQNLQFALNVGDYFHIIDNGTIVFSGDKTSLLSNREIQVRYLGVGI